jgi:mono/diheme cytochrome c family protein
MAPGLVTRTVLVAAASLAAVVAALGWLVWPSHVADGAMPASVDIAEGRALYAEYCASCHGADLEGEPDWQTPRPDGRLPAPPHDETGHTWHHPDSVLFRYTKLGGAETLAQQGVDFDSAMPGFGDRLSDQQVWDILAYIKSTWPERARQVQAARTEANQQQGGT